MPFPQLLSFDIDTTLPRGWGGMSRFVRSSSPAKRVPPHPLCKSPLYFQQLTNCFFAKSFSLIRIQAAPGGGGDGINISRISTSDCPFPTLPTVLALPRPVYPACLEERRECRREARRDGRPANSRRLP